MLGGATVPATPPVAAHTAAAAAAATTFLAEGADPWLPARQALLLILPVLLYKLLPCAWTAFLALRWLCEEPLSQEPPIECLRLAFRWARGVVDELWWSKLVGCEGRQGSLSGSRSASRPK